MTKTEDSRCTLFYLLDILWTSVFLVPVQSAEDTFLSTKRQESGCGEKFADTLQPAPERESAMRRNIVNVCRSLQ